MVSQMEYDGGKFLQRFPDMLGASLQLSMDHSFQVVIAPTILMH
jgi:hypothetical protein